MSDLSTAQDVTQDLNLGPATREILWNIESPFNLGLMYFLFAVSMLIFGWGIYRRIKLYLGSKKISFSVDNFSAHFKNFFSGAVLQKGVNRKKHVKIFHSLITWGFVILTITTTVVALDYDFNLDIYQGNFYLLLTLLSDLFGLGLGIGVFWAFWVRYIQKPDRLHRTPADLIMLVLLELMVVQGFLLEGLRIAAIGDPWANWSPVGKFTAFLLSPLPDSMYESLHYGTWWFHTVTVFGFFAILPYSKFMHIVTASLNLFFKPIRAQGALEDMGDLEKLMEEAMENDSEDFSLGINNVTDLSWKTKLDLDACTSCGRCQELCPAYGSGKALSPKWLVLDARDHMLGLRGDNKIVENSPGKNLSGPGFLNSSSNPLNKLDSFLLKNLYLRSSGTKDPSIKRADNELVQKSALKIAEAADTPLAGGVMEEDVFWSCNTCGACEEICPVGIKHIDLITGVRRNLALIEGKIPHEAQSSLRAIETRDNPFGPKEARADWTKGLEVPVLEDGDEVDVLYWVGCVSAFDKRKQSIARSMSKILNNSNLSWGILGNRECCSGDPARRLGEENLFQTQVKKNVPIISNIKFKTIVANCPHCFNSLKNEYPQLKSEFPPEGTRIIHHTQLISELIANGNINLSKELPSSTFHDPCYLGRFNAVYDTPREILAKLSKTEPVEMENHKEKSKCCGAGGGHFWMDMKVGERVNVQRTKEAIETGAKTVATGCPFCLQMLEDGVKIVDGEDSNSGEPLEIKDLAELVAENMG